MIQTCRPMLKLIKNANIYSPDKKGINDILIAFDKIVAMEKKIDLAGVKVECIDAQGRIATPGFIDLHVHLIGGGGQTGYASLVPEVSLHELIACGTTTVVGLLGTDGFVKELTTLYAKAKALDMEGLSAYMLTSYYGLPEKTILASVADDLIFIDKVIGCKLAMSDDRSPFPDRKEILRLVHQVRLGGFTSNKGGVLHIHLGNLPEGITLLLDIARAYPTLIPYLSPTHLTRTQALFEQAIAFAGMGGMIDFSTGGTTFDSPHRCVIQALDAGVPIHQITFSSDGRGGVRKINPDTGEDTYTPAPLHLNLQETRRLIQDAGLPPEQSLRLITSNPARTMKLTGKGRLENGYDADICLLNDDFQLTDVFARGERLMKEGIIIKKERYDP
jgi:beta-aspartyl-dipeptidase (metallo-type)